MAFNSTNLMNNANIGNQMQLTYIENSEEFNQSKTLDPNTTSVMENVPELQS